LRQWMQLHAHSWSGTCHVRVSPTSLNSSTNLSVTSGMGC